MKMPALPTETPHKPAALVFALLTVCTVLGLHTKLGISDADLLRLLEAGMFVAAAAFAYLRPKKTETVELKGEVGP